MKNCSAPSFSFTNLELGWANVNLGLIKTKIWAGDKVIQNSSVAMTFNYKLILWRISESHIQ